MAPAGARATILTMSPECGCAGLWLTPSIECRTSAPAPAPVAKTKSVKQNQKTFYTGMRVWTVDRQRCFKFGSKSSPAKRKNCAFAHLIFQQAACGRKKPHRLSSASTLVIRGAFDFSCRSGWMMEARWDSEVPGPETWAMTSTSDGSGISVRSRTESPDGNASSRRRCYSGTPSAICCNSSPPDRRPNARR